MLALLTGDIADARLWELHPDKQKLAGHGELKRLLRSNSPKN
jgi:hypothetical protein